MRNAILFFIYAGIVQSLDIRPVRLEIEKSGAPNYTFSHTRACVIQSIFNSVYGNETIENFNKSQCHSDGRLECFCGSRGKSICSTQPILRNDDNRDDFSNDRKPLDLPECHLYHIQKCDNLPVRYRSDCQMATVILTTSKPYLMKYKQIEEPDPYLILWEEIYNFSNNRIRLIRLGDNCTLRHIVHNSLCPLEANSSRETIFNHSGNLKISDISVLSEEYVCNCVDWVSAAQIRDTSSDNYFVYVLISVSFIVLLLVSTVIVVWRCRRSREKKSYPDFDQNCMKLTNDDSLNPAVVLEVPIETSVSEQTTKPDSHSESDEVKTSGYVSLEPDFASAIAVDAIVSSLKGDTRQSSDLLMKRVRKPPKICQLDKQITLNAVGGANPIGRGSFGEVWRVRSTETDQVMALKRISLYKSLEHFKWKRHKLHREVQIMSQVRHLNIVTMVDSWFEIKTPTGFKDNIDLLVMNMLSSSDKSNNLFILMEMCTSNLRSWLTQHPTVQERLIDVDMVKMLSDILNGLKALHDTSIIHRDLKPDNILYKWDEERGRKVWKLVDFGLSRNFELEEIRIDSVASQVGSFTYRSPEMMSCSRGEGYTNKTDIFSAGLVLLEILCTLLEKMDKDEKFDLIRGYDVTSIQVLIDICSVSVDQAVYSFLKEIVVNMISKYPGKRSDSDGLLSRLNQIS